MVENKIKSAKLHEDTLKIIKKIQKILLNSDRVKYSTDTIVFNSVKMELNRLEEKK